MRDWVPLNIEPTDAAYLAGIFDGEGSVCISFKRARLAGNADDCFLVAVVTMTDEPTVRRFHDLFGGYFYCRRNQTGQPLFRWQIRMAQLAPFLATVGPYLRIKRPQAELAKEFLEARVFLGGRNRIPPEILAARASMRDLMSELNHSHQLYKRSDW